eukprot:477950_1
MCVSEESIVKKEYEIKEPDVSLSEDVIRNNIISKGSAGILLSEDVTGSKVPVNKDSSEEVLNKLYIDDISNINTNPYTPELEIVFVSENNFADETSSVNITSYKIDMTDNDRHQFVLDNNQNNASNNIECRSLFDDKNNGCILDNETYGIELLEPADAVIGGAVIAPAVTDNIAKKCDINSNKLEVVVKNELKNYDAKSNLNMTDNYNLNKLEKNKVKFIVNNESNNGNDLNKLKECEYVKIRCIVAENEIKNTLDMILNENLTL